MKKLRVYIDTSVVGGRFDPEFSTHTDLFFEGAISGQFTLIVSDLLEAELKDAPKYVATFLSSVPAACIERVSLSETSDSLALEYIQAKVVGKTSLVDCQHIAIATVADADILVSWNFKHIVNVVRIRGYNSVNLANGYKTLEIRNPRDLIE